MLDHRAVPSLSQAMLRELTLDDDEELEVSEAVHMDANIQWSD